MTINFSEKLEWVSNEQQKERQRQKENRDNLLVVITRLQICMSKIVKAKDTSEPEDWLITAGIGLKWMKQINTRTSNYVASLGAAVEQLEKELKDNVADQTTL